MDITSAANPRIKHLVALRRRRVRDADAVTLVEGYEEVDLALSAGVRPMALYYSPDLVRQDAAGIEAMAGRAAAAGGEVVTVSGQAFARIAYRESPDGWLAVVPALRADLASLSAGPRPLVLICQGVEKPGNLGAILRTADAAHVDALLVCDPRVDLWNPNVVRASRGAVFSVPAVEGENASAWEWLKRRGLRVLAATPSAQTLYTDANMREPLAVAVGTEDEGLTDFWLSRADLKIKIPMMGKVNSLNVSVSTALILYEAVRQRDSRPL